MTEEEVVAVEAPAEDTATQSTEETTEQVQDDVKESTEAVDEKGVPLRNRIAEAERKLHKVEKVQETQSEQDEAIRIVREIAREEAGASSPLIQKLVVKQFLLENPDAANLVDEMNQIRVQHPELSSIDKLDLVYKLAKSDKQEATLVEQEIKRTKELEEKTIKGNQASVESGQISSPTSSLAERIKNAKSIEELDQLAALIK